MNLQEEMTAAAGNQIAAEIDFTILADMLVQIGWRRIILKPMTMETSQEIDAWCGQHVQGSFENMGLVWLFEQEQDANWFALRWL
jgi:hypothetical protein